MKISMEALGSTDPLDLPCVRFQGHGRTRHGYATSAELRDVFSLAARPFGQALWSFAYDMAANPRVRPELRGPTWVMLPEFVFDVDPLPQAYTLVQEAGVVTANLGFFVTTSLLSRTINWLQDRVLGSPKFTLDEIAEAPVPDEVLEEILSVFELWRELERTGTFDIDRHMGHVQASAFARMEPVLHVMCRLVFFHETSHWMKVAYRPAAWRDLMNRTRDHLVEWASFSHPMSFISDPHRAMAVSAITHRTAVSDSWAEEIQCDLMAKGAAIAAGGGWHAGGAAVYFPQGVLYSLVLNLQEYYAVEIAGTGSSHRTHPPAQVRRSIVGYIDARERGFSPQESPVNVAAAELAVFLHWLKVMEAVDAHLQRPRTR